jgi:hypothetical protein
MPATPVGAGEEEGTGAVAGLLQATTESAQAARASPRRRGEFKRGSSKFWRREALRLFEREA